MAHHPMFTRHGSASKSWPAVVRSNFDSAALFDPDRVSVIGGGNGSKAEPITRIHEHANKFVLLFGRAERVYGA